mgnify:FL=1
MTAGDQSKHPGSVATTNDPSVALPKGYFEMTSAMIVQGVSQRALSRQFGFTSRMLRRAFEGEQSLPLVVIRQKVCMALGLDHSEVWPGDATFLAKERMTSEAEGTSFDFLWHLALKGQSIRGLAEAMNTTPRRIAEVVRLAPQRPSRRVVPVRQLIARELEVPYDMLWGRNAEEDVDDHDYYAKNLTRLVSLIEAKRETMLDLSKFLNVSFTGMMQLARGQHMALSAHRQIADRYGSTIEELWPNLYETSGDGQWTVRIEHEDEALAFVHGWPNPEWLNYLHARIKHPELPGDPPRPIADQVHAMAQAKVATNSKG